MINLKVEDDMKDVLTKMDSMFAKFDSKFAQKFAQIDSKFAHVEDKISTVYWVIGLSVGLSTALTAIFIALKNGHTLQSLGCGVFQPTNLLFHFD